MCEQRFTACHGNDLQSHKISHARITKRKEQDSSNFLTVTRRCRLAVCFKFNNEARVSTRHVTS